ncbi:glutamate 5-kinase [Citricoccus sp. SGAir0253]|uniref:glutamate 5-kinase n=1 Tax=Citricoccus sp. SGAir0253 TaxID=2567881 RepID=UPI0010CCC95A|nr:glutamate 5-kinase [Citricoccus sp. SGAir0253]QCU78265.1 glutamate 5-kinase [Citricoccus sp. SGAir0253]
MAEPVVNPVTGRDTLHRARRLVIKIGSSSLTTPTGLNHEAINSLVDTIAAARARGTEVALVSSGTIAAGIHPLGLGKRPRDLATQQAAAAVGQGKLLAHYAASFARHQTEVAQVLLTAEDLIRRTQYKNAFRALNRLLALAVVPIINENDTVTTAEIRFGDNDRLSALVANLLRADALLLLTDVDGLHTGPPSRPGSRRIPSVTSRAELEDVTIGRTGPAGVGTGGMVTKVEAAGIATGAGIHALVTSAANAHRALAGEDVGTWFQASGKRRTARSIWLGLLAEVHGRVVLDDGAVTAVVKNKRSLLPAGVTAVEGRFDAGDAIELADAHGTVVARGFVNYSSTELPEMLGRTTADLREELGPEYQRPVVHTDDCVRLSARAQRRR